MLVRTTYPYFPDDISYTTSNELLLQHCRVSYYIIIIHLALSSGCSHADLHPKGAGHHIWLRVPWGHTLAISLTSTMSKIAESLIIDKALSLQCYQKSVPVSWALSPALLPRLPTSPWFTMTVPDQQLERLFCPGFPQSFCPCGSLYPDC